MFGCGVTLGVTIGRKSPLCFWCLIHWLHLSSTTGGGFKSLVGCGFKSLYFTTSFPRYAHCFSFLAGLRKLRSSLLAPIRRNPLCCLGCQLMSNRFAQLAVGIRFWMNCAICAEWRSARRHPDEKGIPWLAFSGSWSGCHQNGDSVTNTVTI